MPAENMNTPDAKIFRPEDERLRVAIVATPRSGNTWLRHLLSDVYQLENIVIDRPEELPLDQLPERCIIQLHWAAEASLIEMLRHHQVTPITICRHPCDVLVSILHFSTTWPGTALWCGGRCGNESAIVGALPASSAFLEYVLGPRARHLLEVSAGWRRSGASYCVRYESLVADTAGELRRLTEHLAPVDEETIANSVRLNSMENLQTFVHNQHFWRGRPGAWKEFLPDETIRQVAEAHGDIFEATGYVRCSPTGVDERQSDRNWLNQEIITLRQELSRTREQMRQIRDTTHHQGMEICGLRAQLEPLLAKDEEAQKTVTRMDRLAQRHPQVYAAVVTCLRPLFKRAA